MFEVGNIAARLSGIFSDDGFKKFGKAYDDSSTKAKKPVEAELGAKVNQKGFDEAKLKADQWAKTRAEANFNVNSLPAEEKLLRLQGAITILEHQIEEDKSVNVDVGAALVQLELLQREAKKTQREIGASGLQSSFTSLGLAAEDLGAKLGGEAAGAVGGGGGEGGLRAVIGGVSGSMGGMAAAAAAATPIILGLGGALGAVAGSLGAAAGGAGALGVGSIGALATGLLSVVAVAKPLSGEFKNITKAQDAYNQVIKQYGSDSKEATKAQKDLNAQIRANGGREMVQIIDRVKELGKEWKQVTRPAQNALTGLINTGVKNAQQVLPSVGGDVNRNVVAFSDAASDAVKTLRSGGILGILKEMSDLFDRSIGPGLDAVTKTFLAFGNIARASAPWVGELVQDMDDLASRFFNSTRDSDKLNSTIAGLVDQFVSWAKLIESVGRLLYNFFSAGAGQGKGLVDGLTGLINKWTDWEKSIKGTRALQDFFHDSIDLTKNFLGVLGPLLAAVGVLVRASMPAFNDVFKVLKPVAEGVFVVIRDLSKLLGGNLVRYILDVVAAVGVWKGAMIALDFVLNANPIGLIIAALALLYVGFKEAWEHSETFRKVVTASLDWTREAVELFADRTLGLFTGVLGGIQAVVEFSSHIPGVGNKFKGVADAIGTARDKIDKFREGLRQSKKSSDDAGNAADNQKGKIRQLRDEYDKARAKMKDFKKGTDDYKDAAEEARKKSKELSDAIGDVGDKSKRSRKPVQQLTDNIDSLAGVGYQTAVSVAHNLNATLKDMGAKPINVTLQSPRSASTSLGVPNIGGLPGKATGGIPHPGSGARDDHMLIDPGGRPVAMMSGTEGILNTPQMGIVNYALGGMAALGLLPNQLGSLGDLWGSGMTHYAGGGVMQRANQLENLHLPYVWGGHHGDRGPIRDPRPGLDCSSSVSYVLGIPPRVSGAFENYGSPGTGKGIDIFANPVHVFMKIGNRFFGTSRSNPEGGPGWIEPRSTAGFVARTVSAAGLTGGTVEPPRVSGTGLGVRMARAEGKTLAKAANSYLDKQMLSLDNVSGQPLSDASGRYSKSELMHLWKSVNGNLGNPNLMAAIALAESAGDPNAGHQHPYHGLWQVGPGGSFDPTTNAREAGGKLRQQGLRAWETYTNGAYRQFLKKGGLIRHFTTGGGLGANPLSPSWMSGIKAPEYPSASTVNSTTSLRVLRTQQVDHIGDFDKITNDLSDLQRTYNQTDRRYGQSEEVLIDPKTGLINQAAIEKRAGELAGLIKIRERIVKALERAQAKVRDIIKTYTTLVNRLTGSLKHAKAKDRPGIRRSIAQYSTNRDEWRGKLHDLGFDVTDAKLDVGDLQKEGSELRGTVSTPTSDSSSSSSTGDSSTSSDGSGGGLTADQQALLNQAEQLKAIVSRGTFLNTAAASVLGGVTDANSVGNASVPALTSTSVLDSPLMLTGTSTPGSASPVGGGPSGAGPTVVFQSYVPPSPQQASELARYVTQGLGYQGSVSSSRDNLGL